MLLEICPLGDAVWWIGRWREVPAQDAAREREAWRAHYFEPMYVAGKYVERPLPDAGVYYDYACSQLRDKLHAGNLAASGQQGEDDRWPRKEIPPFFWAEATINVNPGGIELANAWDNQTRWYRITVSGKAMLKLWPAVTPPSPRGRKPGPIWSWIKPTVLAWLDNEGVQPLAAVERYIADLLAGRGEERSESTVRKYAKKYIEAFVAQAESGNRR